MSALMRLNDLSVWFDDPARPAVDGVSLTVEAGRMLALVGESGSGKSLTALSILDLLPAGAHHRAGAIELDGEDVQGWPDARRRRLRGGDIGTIFQEPLTALNPLHSVGKQIGEAIRVHQGLGRQAVRARSLELLAQVDLPASAETLARYPHQLSGGQRQRVMIAMALANNPRLLIADEPTTALDVTIQETILELLKRLQRELNLGILLISHDLGLVSRFAEDVAVMHRGKLVESGPVDDVLERPKADYTRHLIAAEPGGAPRPLPADAPLLLNAEDLLVRFHGRRRFGGFGGRDSLNAVDRVSLQVRRGETLGVVGESGSGKSTLALALLRLTHAAGRITLLDQRLDTLHGAALRPWRRHLQVVFQDPYGSLNPRLTVGQAVSEGLRVHHKDLNAAQRQARTRALLEEVGLSAEAVDRYPHEFSGGQRQRIAIARALVVQPDLLILDEPTSALDRSVQAQVLELLKTLQDRHGLSYLFISHDLKVVRAISHRLMVMRHGKVIEAGDTEQLFTAPAQDYTRQLIDAAFSRHRKQAVAH
ncbi:ABC transporter ATP-binding protein [Alloalcanivorax mobilis]|uniref:ABC transporter ATP-binding protein n=1 Tax=Alloalcanivorax mobilis TaxID=2019569 RepID=UPI000C7708C0|nr:dipeptide ABC transporter ATP-binding protein [Alloalcanivorax mobilis]